MPLTRIKSTSIDADSINSSKIIDGQVATADIADSAVTTAKINTDAVTNAKVADDAIGLDELSATGTPSSSTFLRGDNAWAEVNSGAGYFLGENGATGDTTDGLGDIFRVHEDALDTNVTIAANTNALASGPLTFNATVTVNGTLTVV